jgi:hypothetical protein
LNLTFLANQSAIKDTQSLELGIVLMAMFQEGHASRIHVMQAAHHNMEMLEIAPVLLLPGRNASHPVMMGTQCRVEHIAIWACCLPPHVCRTTAALNHCQSIVRKAIVQASSFLDRIVIQLAMMAILPAGQCNAAWAH